MKKNFICAAAAVAVAVAFAACGNKSEAEAAAAAADSIAEEVPAAIEAEVVEAVDTVTGDTVVAAEVAEIAPAE